MLTSLKQVQAIKALTRLLVEANRTASHGLFPMQRVTAQRFAALVQAEIDTLQGSGYSDHKAQEARKVMA